MRGTLKERFWDKVDKRGQDECWEWTAYTDKCGYGHIRIDGEMPLAHRISWGIHNGPIPEMDGTDYRGTCVCHTCDNPGCVNPNHLFIATHAENIKDRSIKGRTSRKSVNQGEDYGMSKLTEDMVRMIRRYYKNGGCTQSWLAQIYGVTQTNIGCVIRLQTWSHI